MITRRARRIIVWVGVFLSLALPLLGLPIGILLIIIWLGMLFVKSPNSGWRKLDFVDKGGLLGLAFGTFVILIGIYIPKTVDGSATWEKIFITLMQPAIHIVSNATEGFDGLGCLLYGIPLITLPPVIYLGVGLVIGMLIELLWNKQELDVLKKIN